MSRLNVKVGDTIAVVRAPHRNGGERELFAATVTKVGRKYVTAVRDQKYPSLTMQFTIDGGNGVDCFPAQRAWISEAERDDDLALEDVRSEVSRLARDLYDYNVRRLDGEKLLKLRDLLREAKS